MVGRRKKDSNFLAERERERERERASALALSLSVQNLESSLSLT
jgi:hypothetical protein